MGTSVSMYVCVCLGALIIVWTLMCVCVCVCVCVCTCSESSTSSLIGLQRGSGLAGGWPADQDDDDPSWGHYYLPSLNIPPSIRPVIPPSLFSSASHWDATVTWPPPSWCLYFPFLFPLIHSYWRPHTPSPHPSAFVPHVCLFAHQSTTRTLLKCLLAMCYFCRVWCGCI